MRWSASRIICLAALYGMRVAGAASRSRKKRSGSLPPACREPLRIVVAKFFRKRGSRNRFFEQFAVVPIVSVDPVGLCNGDPFAIATEECNRVTHRHNAFFLH